MKIAITWEYMDTLKQTGMKEITEKSITEEEKNLLQTKLCCRNLIKEENTWAVPPFKILRTILKMGKGGTPINEPKDKEIRNDAGGLTRKR